MQLQKIIVNSWYNYSQLNFSQMKFSNNSQFKQRLDLFAVKLGKRYILTFFLFFLIYSCLTALAYYFLVG